MVVRWTWRFELLYILTIFDGLLSGMAYVGMRGSGVRTRGGRGAGIWADERFTRGDKNFFAMLREPSRCVYIIPTFCLRLDFLESKPQTPQFGEKL